MSRMALDTLSFLSAFHRTMLGTGYGGCFQGVISELKGPVWPSSSEDIYSARKSQVSNHSNWTLGYFILSTERMDYRYVSRPQRRNRGGSLRVYQVR
ncbi:uncharacterized protein P174DRAFT_443410 [Aspergillus novofumigatus IBT 16806]|uniref:Uncharacterized protein n=1 Tax=Aspergillus novofumigatus (strain IBT 16806) TaxID=1392255 RepID=A0A2I1C173_ASPN1|nr:uncharacterized protein P174DRAFT_443410 [Aspergillus novofumigatus IBT 16806]PKX91388.1 hypothetical protein P174DRAFT_443410 [Aspergillus novofumigatus IBT 16806]